MSSSMVGRSLGQYKILSVLGSGGMATVYLGYQSTIDRQVAIKILPPHPGLDDDFRERFKREARTIGNLQNPGILPLYDFGVQDDISYLVMAYIEDGTLEDLIDSGPMAVQDVERILRIIAAALDYAHQQGVIHRDIKPANILMQDGHPLLADFGMVKMLAQDSNITGTAIVGTPAYMPPEQGNGLAIDGRADVYSLGVIVYEMLTGQQLYSSNSPMQMIFQHMNEPIPDVLALRPDLPEEMRTVMNQVLAKSPSDRYQTAGDFAQAFSKAISGLDSSFLKMQKELPVGVPTEKVRRNAQSNQTQILETLPEADEQEAATGSQTIIVRERNSPIVMILAAFGLMALGIVLAVLVFLNNRPEPTEVITAISTVRGDVAINNATPIPVAETHGEVRFRTVSDDEAVLGNTISIRLDDVDSPPDGQVYAAWLYNTQTEDSLFIGEFAVDAIDGRGDLLPTNLDTTRVLPAFYNAVLITEEAAASIGDSPSETVTYSGQLPVEAMVAMREIFVLGTGDSLIRSDNGEREDMSLLAAAVTEAGFAVEHADNAASRSPTLAIAQSHAEHTVNILSGGFEDLNDSGRAENPGIKVGVVPQTEAIESLLLDAITHEDATNRLQTNAEFMRICVQNVRDWSLEIIERHNNLFEAQPDETLDAFEDDLTIAATLTTQLTQGVDANGTDGIEPFEGECGLDQISEYGLQLSSITIFEGDILAEAE